MSENSEGNNVRGVVTADPVEAMVPGDAIHFSAPRIKLNVPQRSATVANWELFQGALLSINFINGAQHQVEGSAVMVAPGIALCATHVLEPRLDELMAGRIVATCLGISTHGMEIWKVIKITEVPGTDITILGLEYASEFPPNKVFNLAGITTRLPKKGEELLVCGFRASEKSFPVVDGLGSEIEGNIWICKGEVRERHTGGRDKYMLPWPVLEVDCPAWGGMSGGPVYDANGLLVGLLCSSIDLGSGDGVSYVSLHWPALTARTEPCWPRGVLSSPISLLEIERICLIDRRDAIRASYDEAASRTITEYKIWE